MTFELCRVFFEKFKAFGLIFLESSKNTAFSIIVKILSLVVMNLLVNAFIPILSDRIF